MSLVAADLPSSNSSACSQSVTSNLLEHLPRENPEPERRQLVAAVLASGLGSIADEHTTAYSLDTGYDGEPDSVAEEMACN